CPFSSLADFNPLQLTKSPFLLLKFKEFQCFFQEQIRIFWIFLGYFYFPLNFFQIICNHSIYS
ncbi:TPA: ISL3 family transposase, partial [Streptococcus pneumoniae]